MMRIFRVALASLAALGASIGAAGAQSELGDAAEASAFVVTLIEDLSGIASEAGLQTQALRDRMTVAMNPEPMARFMLGPDGQAAATEDQLERYHALFPDYIAGVYASEIEELANRTIRVIDVVERGGKEHIVQSELLKSNGQVGARVDFRVRWYDGEPALVDVLVEFVSPLVTKRSEAAEMIEREGVEALLAHMESIAEGVESPSEAG